MSKVDLDMLRRAKAVLEADWFTQALASAELDLNQLLRAENILKRGWFCRECGEESPDGWVQWIDSGPGGLSYLLCKQCADRLLERGLPE